MIFTDCPSMIATVGDAGHPVASRASPSSAHCSCVHTSWRRKHRLGFGEPVRGAALNAPSLLGDTSGLVGRPGRAALATVQLEMVADAFETDPRYRYEISGGALDAIRLGWQNFRGAIGIAPYAARAARRAVPRGGPRTRRRPPHTRGSRAGRTDVPGRRFHDAPPTRAAAPPPRVSEAAGAATVEIRRLDHAGRQGW
jgi:hypothetical protein